MKKLITLPAILAVTTAVNFAQAESFNVQVDIQGNNQLKATQVQAMAFPPVIVSDSRASGDRCVTYATHSQDPGSNALCPSDVGRQNAQIKVTGSPLSNVQVDIFGTSQGGFNLNGYVLDTNGPIPTPGGPSSQVSLDGSGESNVVIGGEIYLMDKNMVRAQDGFSLNYTVTLSYL